MVELSPKSAAELLERSATTGVNVSEAIFVRRMIPTLETAARIERSMTRKSRQEAAVSEAEAADAEIRHADAVRKAKLTKKLGTRKHLRKVQMARAKAIISQASAGIAANHEHRAGIMRSKADARRQGKMVQSYRRDKAARSQS